MDYDDYDDYEELEEEQEYYNGYLGDVLIYPELQEALLGIMMDYNVDIPIAVYSYEKSIGVFMKHGLSLEEALEHLDFNYVGAYLGEDTPRFVYEEGIGFEQRGD